MAHCKNVPIKVLPLWEAYGLHADSKVHTNVDNREEMIQLAWGGILACHVLSLVTAVKSKLTLLKECDLYIIKNLLE